MLERTQINDSLLWDQALLGLPTPHVLQCWAWGELKSQTGWRASRWLWQREGEPVAGGALLTRRLAGRVPLAVSYVPKGPILDWADADLATAVLEQLAALARRSGSIFLKIDPDVRVDQPTGEAVRTLLRRLGWTPSAEQIQFRNTVVSDLSMDEDAILAGMKPKWRYNIRLADRKGVAVRSGGSADLETFYAMYAETGDRDGFLVRPFPYYRMIWERFLAEGRAHLLLATVEGSAVAGILLFRFGATAWYFYGASTQVARALMPNYALQWAAMRWAKAQGCTRYDWWGAPDELDEGDPMWGVYRFKEGFGGEFVPGLGAWDRPLSSSLYRIYTEILPRILGVMRRHRETDAMRRAADTRGRIPSPA